MTWLINSYCGGELDHSTMTWFIDSYCGWELDLSSTTWLNNSYCGWELDHNSKMWLVTVRAWSRDHDKVCYWQLDLRTMTRFVTDSLISGPWHGYIYRGSLLNHASVDCGSFTSTYMLYLTSLPSFMYLMPIQNTVQFSLLFIWLCFWCPVVLSHTVYAKVI